MCLRNFFLWGRVAVGRSTFLQLRRSVAAVRGDGGALLRRAALPPPWLQAGARMPVPSWQNVRPVHVPCSGVAVGERLD